MHIIEQLLSSPDLLIYMTLIIPILGAFLAATIKDANKRDSAVILTSVILFLHILVNIFPRAGSIHLPPVTLIEIFPNLSVTFSIDPFGMIFLFVASFLWIITSIYSIGYMRGNNEKNQNRFYTFFALAIFGTMGIAMSGNLFTLFLFYEFITICTFPLVSHSGTQDAMKSARIYLGILLGTSICFFLTAMIWTYSITGTLDFSNGGIMTGKIGPITTGILLFLFMFGIGKAALMPFHLWLPAAMVAPTPVSALLHAVAVVKAGVFTVLKIIVYIFGTEHLEEMMSQNWWSSGWLVYISGFTIVAASFIAMRQDNLKKRLAYSTISQLSYITMAAALLAPKAIMAAGFHIAAHAIGKITLFFAAGSIYTASKKKYVSELDGIGKRMPITMIAFSIAAISMIGLPPAAGFITKFYILDGAVQTSHYFAIIVLLLSTMLNAAYFLPIIYAAFFKKETQKTKNHGEAPIAIVIAISITALLTIGFFFYPTLFLLLSKASLR